MFLAVESMNKSCGILRFFPHNHSPRWYFSWYNLKYSVEVLNTIHSRKTGQNSFLKITPRGVITQEETEYTT